MAQRIKLDVNEVARFYMGCKSLGQTAKQFKISPAGLAYWLRNQKIAINQQGGTKSRYRLNSDYFKTINTPEKAYWLGFLYADGNVYKGKQGYKVTLSASSKDIEHVEKFKIAIGSDNPIKEYECKLNDRLYPQAKIVISGKDFVESIIDKGCVPNKTFLLKFPKWLNGELNSHFIRGYFDGDGCIHINKKGHKIWSVLGCEDFIKDLQAILIKECKLSETKISVIGKIHNLIYGGNKSVSRISEYLYHDAVLFLERKKDKF